MNLKSYTLSVQLLRLVDLREKIPWHSLDSKQHHYSSCLILAELGQSERRDRENFIFVLLSLALSLFLFLLSWDYEKEYQRQI
jgi:hypothetical protein